MQAVDQARGTGKTTKALKSAIFYAALENNPVVFICYNHAQTKELLRYTVDLCNMSGISVSKIENQLDIITFLGGGKITFMPINDLTRRFTGMPQTKKFKFLYDHFSFEQKMTWNEWESIKTIEQQHKL